MSQGKEAKVLYNCISAVGALEVRVLSLLLQLKEGGRLGRELLPLLHIGSCTKEI